MRGRCSESGCKRIASADSPFCPVHRVRQVATSEMSANPAYQRWGEHAEIDPVLVSLMQQAGSVKGLNGEIGALRLVLHQLLTDDSLPVGDLARHVARITAVIAQVCKTQRVIDGETGDSITDALTQLLIELDGGK